MRAVKSVIAPQLGEAMTARNLTRAAMAERMQTSRAQLNRVLDPEGSNVTLETLSRAARVVGCGLKVELVQGHTRRYTPRRSVKASQPRSRRT